MNKEYLTTFQAAKLMSVTPDSVLKWIKLGKLATHRTLGGHHRIEKSSIDALFKKSKISSSESESPPEANQYCWEFNAWQRNCVDRCEDCIVYRARAKRCFEMSEVPSEFGSLKLFCESTCDTCEYYKYVNEDN